MKHIFFILLVTLMFSTIILQGCIDQNNSGSKLVTASLNTLGFKSNELPYTIIKQNETFNNTEIFVEFPQNVTVRFLEVYRVEYVINETQILLTLDMKKLNSTDVAKEQFEREKIDLSDSNYDIITAETIGDESIVGRDRDLYLIIFRKYNIVATIIPSVYKGLSIQDFIDYTKIIVNHIESSV